MQGLGSRISGLVQALVDLSAHEVAKHPKLTEIPHPDLTGASGGVGAWILIRVPK